MYKTSQMPLVHCLCINTLYVIDVTPYVLADVIAYVQHFFISYIHNYSNASGTLRIYQHSVCHRRYSLCISRRYCLCIQLFFFLAYKTSQMPVVHSPSIHTLYVKDVIPYV